MRESEEISVSAMEILPSKRIKAEEMTEEGSDRMSALPDGLLVEILSRLPSTESAIRTGILSKRWKYVWPWVHTLIFKDGRHIPSPSDFAFFVDKTLTQCDQSKLKKFALLFRYDVRFRSQVSNWIRYAIACNVEELELMFCFISSHYILNEDSFFNSCVTDLTLQHCIFKPNGAISWKNLRSLQILHCNIDEDLIQNILCGSPCLEMLVLDGCYGYRRLDIISKTVKELVFYGYSDQYDIQNVVVEINAPNILSLAILGCLFLGKLVLLNVSSLVEARLDYRKFGYWNDRETTWKEDKEEILKGFIQSLCHVKELELGPFCSKVLSCLEAKGFTLPSNAKFPVKFTDNAYSDSDTDDEWDTDDNGIQKTNGIRNCDFDSDSHERCNWLDLYHLKFMCMLT